MPDISIKPYTMQSDVMTPSGDTLTIEHPSDATDEEIQAQAMRLDQEQQSQQAEAQKPTWGQKLMATWPGRIAQAGYNFATLPGDVAMGRQEVDLNDPEFLKRMTDAAQVVSEGTLPLVTRAGPSSWQLLNVGGHMIDKAVNSGLMFSEKAVQAGIDAIRSKLPSQASGTHAVLNNFEQKVQSGQPLTFADLKAPRDEFQGLQGDASRGSVEMRGATIAKHGIDDMVRGTPEGNMFIEGNKNYEQGMKVKELEERSYWADMGAAVANSGQNAGNKIRQSTMQWLKNEGETFSPEAYRAGERVAFGSPLENKMRYYGNMLGGGGGLGAASAGGFGALITSGGNPTAAIGTALAIPAFGGALKLGATEAARLHAKQFADVLRSEAPLAQTINQQNYYSGIDPVTLARRAAMIKLLLTQGVLPTIQTGVKAFNEPPAQAQ